MIDGTGIKVEGEGEWNGRKHGRLKRRLSRKIHIGIDEETLKIRAIEATSSSISDAPVLPDILNQILPDEETGASQRTVHTIHVNATVLLCLATHMQSFHPVKTLGCGNLIPPVRERETKLSDLQNIWAVHCGGS